MSQTAASRPGKPARRREAASASGASTHVRKKEPRDVAEASSLRGSANAHLWNPASDKSSGGSVAATRRLSGCAEFAPFFAA